MRKQDIEYHVFSDICKAIIDAGWRVNCDTGDSEGAWEFKRGGTNDLEALLRACFYTDKESGLRYAYCDVWTCSVYYGGPSEDSIKHVGDFHCVSGNEGYNLVANYHTILEPYICPTERKWERIADGEDAMDRVAKELSLTYAEAGLLFADLACLMKLAAQEAYQTKTAIQVHNSADTDLIQYSLGRSAGLAHANVWAEQLSHFLTLGDFETAVDFIKKARDYIKKAVDSKRAVCSMEVVE